MGEDALKLEISGIAPQLHCPTASPILSQPRTVVVELTITGDLSPLHTATGELPMLTTIAADLTLLTAVIVGPPLLTTAEGLGSFVVVALPLLAELTLVTGTPPSVNIAMQLITGAWVQVRSGPRTIPIIRMLSIYDVIVGKSYMPPTLYINLLMHELQSIRNGAASYQDVAPDAGYFVARRASTWWGPAAPTLLLLKAALDPIVSEQNFLTVTTVRSLFMAAQLCPSQMATHPHTPARARGNASGAYVAASAGREGAAEAEAEVVVVAEEEGAVAVVHWQSRALQRGDTESDDDGWGRDDNAAREIPTAS
ncbi:hypothetical protein Pelo_17508 [Pelomyxa schiedti]|nr:hypothetical protein Pelo_17508 [Pelomyxa schiedti]